MSHPKETESKSVQRFAFVLLPRFSALTVSSLVEPLRIANYCGGQELFSWAFVSAEGQPVTNSAGIGVPTQAIGRRNEFDTVIVCGGWEPSAH